MKPRGGEHPLTVAVRVRPITDQERAAGGNEVAFPVDKQMVVLMDPTEDPDDILRANRSRERTYVFDHTFGGNDDQEVVYQVTTRFLIDQIINGYNGTVFAYGATGAGKTYTMLGTPDNPGIYARALNDLFLLVAKYEEENVYNVSMSYLEIYNEMVRDLLNPSAGYLDMREDAKGGVQVANLSETTTTSTEEIMELLQRGNMERTQEPTKANQTSSRSHAVLQVTVKQRSRARDIHSQVKIGRLFLVDLAGSERAANTQNRGKRMVEGAHINRSLLALGNCITALSESNDKGARTYVNFRDSKLTRLLKEALGGNCKTVMIAHIAPASLHFEESRNTLLYADRAKRIKNKVRRNVEDVSYHIAQYTQIISELRGEIERLRAKVSQSITQPASIQAVQNEVLRTANDQEFFKLKEQLMLTFKDQIVLRRSLMEFNNASVDASLECNRLTRIISAWESEQLRAKELRGAGDRELEKQLDLEGLSYSSEEPDYVRVARSELKVQLSEKKKCDKAKSNTSKELEITKQKTAILEESLPRYVSTELQKEILTLLLRIHELEIENIENKSEIYVRDNFLSHHDRVIAEYQTYRSMAEEIISQQRELIYACKDLTTPRELEELYDIYLQSSQSLPGMENPLAYRNFLPTIKNGSTTSLIEMGASMANLDRLSTLAEEAPSGFFRQKAIERSTPEIEDQSKVFSVSPRSLGVKAVNNQRHLSVSPMKVKHKEDTMYTLSMRSNSVESLEKKDSLSPADLTKALVPPKVSQETRGIAALAAAKKRRQQQEIMSSRQNLQDTPFNQTFISYDDGDNALTSSRLANHNRVYDSRFNLNDDLESYDSQMVDAKTDGSTPKAGQRIPRASKHRHQALLRVQNQNPGAPVGSSNSDRLIDPTDTHYKGVKVGRKSQVVVRPKQAAWKSSQETSRRQAVVSKPRTNKITSRYLKSFGTVNENTSYKAKPVTERRQEKGNKTQPTIPSYNKGDIAVAGFGLRY
ncbi:kinesin-like protein KIF19 [Watersipora subatra]|uniref:kinesin-like protein KIF19 n=1 Tax=Watersipora subatra TaxID=2589382 RepID=UPI00355BE12C